MMPGMLQSTPRRSTARRSHTLIFPSKLRVSANCSSGVKATDEAVLTLSWAKLVAVASAVPFPPLLPHFPP